MAKLKLGNTVGGLYIPPTKRLKFPTLWIDLIHASPANQLFRSRIKKYKGIKSIDELIGNRSIERDEAGNIRQDLIEIVFDCWIDNWGGWEAPDDQGVQKACPLYDDNGNEVECTVENFTSVVRDTDGGEYLFFEVLSICQNRLWFRAAQADEEKNFLRPLPEQSIAATGRQTRKGPKRARSSK